MKVAAGDNAALQKRVILVIGGPGRRLS